MTIHTSIDHDKRQITSRSDATLELADLIALLDSLVVRDLMSYAKLFDAGDHDTRMDDDGLTVMMARMNAYDVLDGRGPLALVARAASTRTLMLRMMNVDRSRRPVRLFDRMRDALEWLNAVNRPQEPRAAADA